MANPISEQISLAVLARLASVTTGNGFNVTLVAERFSSDTDHRGVRERDHLAVLIEESDTVEDNTAQQLETWFKTYRVDYYAIESEASSTAIDQRLNIGAADIIRAIVADPAAVGTGEARQWNVRATNTFLLGTDRSEPVDGSSRVISVRFQVQYQTHEANPFTQP